MTDELQTPVTEADSLVDERASDADTPDTPDTGALGGTETASNPNAEAAKYRVRAREAETALATAQARIEQFQLRDLANLAGEHLAAPGDLLAVSGNDLASYITDDGELDIERVKADAIAMISERPGLAKNPKVSAIDPSQGLGINPGKVQPSWSLLLEH